MSSALDPWAVLIAAVAGYAFGAAWYGFLGRPWLAALGKTEADLRRGRAATLVLAFVAEVVMALMLAGLMWHLGGATIRAGVISGALIWAGFVMTTLFVNHRFQAARAALTLIDGGHWLGVLVVQGVVLGAFGTA